MSEFSWLYHKYKLLKLLREDVCKDPCAGYNSREQVCQHKLLVEKIDDQLREHRMHCLRCFGLIPDAVTAVISKAPCA